MGAEAAIPLVLAVARGLFTWSMARMRLGYVATIGLGATLVILAALIQTLLGGS